MNAVSSSLSDLRVTFLGTGTSQGVPVIGCECDICLSENTRDKRLRSSILIETSGASILVDAGPDLRQQMLREKIRRLTAVMLTHEHNDHTVGLDDIRPFNFMQGGDIPVYALPRVLSEIKTKFAYVFAENPYPGSPRMLCHPVLAGDIFYVNGEVQVQALGIWHGQLPILGFRIAQFAYITDASVIGEDLIEELRGIDTLVLNSLRYRKHNTHLSFDEAIDIAQRIGAKETYLTHMSHEMGLYSDIMEKMPGSVYPAYDGLQLTWQVT